MSLDERTNGLPRPLSLLQLIQPPPWATQRAWDHQPPNYALQVLHDRAQGCTTVARGPYLIIFALCSPHPPVRKKFERAQNGARGGSTGGARGRPRARLIAHLHPRSDPCISLHTLQTLTDPYVLLHILAYSYILLQILTDSAYPCISLHTLTYPYRLRGSGGWGPRARTILGTNEYIRGCVEQSANMIR